MSQQKGRIISPRLLALAVVALALAAILVIDNLKNVLDPVTRDLNRFAKYEIVYSCVGKHVSSVYDVCTIHGDGSGKSEILAGETAGSVLDSPSINELGQMIFSCSEMEMVKKHARVKGAICSRSNIQDKSLITLETGSVHYSNTDINRSGWVVFQCDSEQICLTSITASGASANPALQLSHGFEPAINDRGWIAFQCNDPSTVKGISTYNICALQVESKSIQHLTHAPDDALYSDPDINELGLILFACQEPGEAPNICSIRLDDPEQRHLTSVQSPSHNAKPRVNADGQIVFECWLDEQTSNICGINRDGSQLHQLTSDGSNDFAPSINEDGVVAYVCGQNLCVINFDGSGLQQLTTLKQDGVVSDPEIQ